MTCKACELLENKETLKVYEDDQVVAVLASKGWVKGQVDVFTKKHETDIAKLDDAAMTHFLQTSAHVASAVFEALGPQGTNVIINEGNILGDNSDNHLCAHIVPRKFEDNLNLMWKPKTMDDEEKDKVLEKLKDKAFALDHKKEGKKEEKQEGKEVAQKDEHGHDEKNDEHGHTGEKIDYRMKQLIRIP